MNPLRRRQAMRPILGAVGAAALVLAAGAPALAALAVGAKAPDFTAQASMAGKQFPFSLSKALEKGPVVLYFFPAAFTHGCNIEAHEFADAQPRYQALGATLVGVTAGNIDRLTEFSVSEGHSKLLRAADTKADAAKQYNAMLANTPRTSHRTKY